MTTALFCAAVVLVAYTYIGYPVLIYLRCLFFPQSWRRAPILPSISIILAVHDGAPILKQKMDHLLAVNYPPEKVQLIVVSDGSTDGTNSILATIRDSRVRCIICEQHNGKAAALNAAMECATGEIVVFVDIRPQLETDALRELVSNFADPHVGCAAGELVLLDKGQDSATRAVSSLYWRYEQWIRTCESIVDSPLGVYGGFYAIRRRLAQPLPRGTILDDMLQPLNIISQGYRSVIDTRAQVFDEWPNTARGEFARKVRTLAGNFQLLQIAPWIVTRKNRLRLELVSHKVLRLFVPALLLITLTTSERLATSSGIFETIFVLQIAFYLLAALGFGHRVPVLGRIAGAANSFCLLNTAVVVGFYKFLFTRGPLWKIWVTTPFQESRKGAGASGSHTVKAKECILPD